MKHMKFFHHLQSSEMALIATSCFALHWHCPAVLNSVLNFSMLGHLTSPLEATPPTHSPFTPLTPPTPPSPQSSVGANSPHLSQAPPNHLESAQPQPDNLEKEINLFEKKYEDLVDNVLSTLQTEGVSVQRVLLKCLQQLLYL